MFSHSTDQESESYKDKSEWKCTSVFNCWNRIEFNHSANKAIIVCTIGVNSLFELFSEKKKIN